MNETLTVDGGSGGGGDEQNQQGEKSSFVHYVIGGRVCGFL